MEKGIIIRKHPVNGDPSVLDLLKDWLLIANVRGAWAKLRKRHPEILDYVSYFKCQGGQTAAINEQGQKLLLTLVQPGTVRGQKNLAKLRKEMFLEEKGDE